MTTPTQNFKSLYPQETTLSLKFEVVSNGIMSLEEKRRLILAFDALIRSRSRGTTIEYAKRLGISKSTFFRLLDYIRNELNAPVLYDHAESRYVYKVEGTLFFGFLPFTVLSKEELRKITGGTDPFAITSSFFDDFFASLN